MNVLHNQRSISGEKKGAFTRDIDIGEIKRHSKEQGATVNDILMSLLSVAISRYQARHKDKLPPVTSMSVGIPFSLRQPEKTIADLKFNNNFVCVPYELPVTSSFAEALDSNKAGFKHMRTSLMPFSVLSCFQASLLLPSPLANIVVDFVSLKHSLVVSNFHATKKRLNLNGKRQTGCFYFVPCPG